MLMNLTQKKNTNKLQHINKDKNAKATLIFIEI